MIESDVFSLDKQIDDTSKPDADNTVCVGNGCIDQQEYLSGELFEARIQIIKLRVFVLFCSLSCFGCSGEK